MIQGHRVAAAAFSILLLAGAAGLASANVPSPTNSTCDTCLVLAPGNSFIYRVIVRDDTNAPVPFAAVSLDFNSVPGVVLCAGQDPDLDGRIVGTTDATGTVDFVVRGGGYSLGFVTVSSVATTLCFSRPRSPDIDASLVVDGLDQSAHDALPVDALHGDYNCDGFSDAADRALLDARFGEDCATVQVDASTWGRIKALYR